MNERVFTPSETAQLFNIGDSTLRKWCIHLERVGYTFTQDIHGHRSFTERDQDALQLMQDCLSKRMTYEDASQAMLSAPQLPSDASEVESKAQYLPSSADLMLLNISGQVEKLVE
jgi:DNA-binding transcriptional MerR regulator